jgi:hypothetical protein
MTKNMSSCVFWTVFVSYCPLFLGSVDIYKEYDSLYILERNEKNSLFLRLWPFSRTIAQVLGSGVIYKAITLSTCLSGLTKNSSFFAF